MDIDKCPAIAPLLGFMGAALSIILANIGAAHGTSKAGVGIMWSGIKSPELIWRNLIPVVMAGVNGIYGLITSIILIGAIRPPTNQGEEGNYYQYSMYTGAAHLAAGLCCGLSALGSGMAIGIAGDAAVTACGTWDSDNKKVKPSIFGRDKKKKGFDLLLNSNDAETESRSTFVIPVKVSKKKNAGGGDKLFVSMILIQVFAGNVALYGLIASILLSQQIYYCGD